MQNPYKFLSQNKVLSLVIFYLLYRHFWSIMKAMEPSVQRKLLMFVTGSDRIPATGATQMNLKIACGGEDCNRLPSAHTCFNQLVLYRYESKDKLEHMLKTAIMESQGFYVK